MQHLIEKNYSIPSAERQREGGCQGHTHTQESMYGLWVPLCMNISVWAHMSVCTCMLIYMPMSEYMRMCACMSAFGGRGKQPFVFATEAGFPICCPNYPHSAFWVSKLRSTWSI